MSLNHIRPWRNIYRRKSRQIMVGNVPVGGDAPITVQTMTNTLTTDVKATIEQVQAAADAGADIVRISVPDEASSKALREIVPEVSVPIELGAALGARVQWRCHSVRVPGQGVR